MVSPKKLLWLGLIFLLVVCIWKGVRYMDGLFVNDSLYTGPTKSYVIGRFVIDVPTVLELQVSTFKVTPIKSEEQILKSYSTEGLTIREQPWQTNNHAQEMEVYAAPYIEDAYLPDEVTHCNKVEDVSHLFGGNKTIRTVKHRYGITEIHIFIELLQGLLHIEESRNLYVGGLYDIEKPAAELFKYYAWGKPQRVGNNVFYTAFGRVEGYPSQEEHFSAVFRNTMDFYLLFSTKAEPILIEGDRLFTTEEAHKLKGKYGATFERYREREVSHGGYTQMEYISKFDGYYGGHIATFDFAAPVTPMSTPQQPNLKLNFESPWEVRDHAMPIWNTVLHSLRPAQQPN